MGRYNYVKPKWDINETQESHKKYTVCTILQKYANEYNMNTDVFDLRDAVVDCIDAHKDEIHEGEAEKASKILKKCRGVSQILSTLATYLTAQKVDAQSKIEEADIFEDNANKLSETFKANKNKRVFQTYISEDLEDEDDDFYSHRNSFLDLWDQVYCSLTDGGQNSVYTSLGALSGKNKYDKRYEIETGEKQGNLDIITVISRDLDYAKRVAEIYGLNTHEDRNRGALSIYIPSEAPVNHEVIRKFRGTKVPPKVRAQGTNLLNTCDNLGYSCKYIPVAAAISQYSIQEENPFASPAYYKVTTNNGDIFIIAVDNSTKLFIEKEVNDDGERKIPSDKRLFLNAARLFDAYEDNLNALKRLKEVESININEDVESSIPVQILPRNDVYDYIISVPEATADRPPFFFPVGYIKELSSEIPAKFRGGRGSEGNHKVRIFKCSEMTVYTGADYENLKATKNYRKETGKERSGERTGFSFSGDSAVVDKIGISARGDEQLQCYIRKGSKPKTKFFISLDDEDLREASRYEVAEYLTPAQANKVLGNIETSTGPEGANIMRLKLSGIYRIGNLGHSIM